MSGHDQEKLTPEQNLAQRAVRSLSEPKASPEFRHRLKEEFVSGRIPPEIRPVPRRRRATLLTVGVLAAAAVIIIGIFLGNQTPDWRLEGPLPSTLIVNGEEVPVDDARQMDDMLQPGASIACEDTMGATIASPGHLYVQLTPCSEVILPETPRRWFGRTLEAEVMHGEVRFVTGESFEGAKLMVETPEVVIEVLGTTIAVIREDFGTCVCVLNGSVKMGPKDGPMEVVNEGRRRTIFNDGRAPFEEEILPMERMKLEMLREVCVPSFAPDDSL
jgi:hypothetical protein